MASNKPGPGQLLVDVQVTSIGAGQTINTVSGTTYTQGAGTTQMTPNSVNSTQPIPGTVWDALFIEVFPGVLNPGQSEPDLWMWPQIDNVDTHDDFYVDISISGNPFPSRDNTVGRDSLFIGASMLKDGVTGQLANIMAKGTRAPLLYTGWKVKKDLTLKFFSNAGFTTGSTGTFAVPPTIKIYGDVYDAKLLAYIQNVMGAYNGAIRLNSVRRQVLGLPPYSIVHDFTGPISLDTWGALPGGTAQGRVKVYRFFKVSQPLVNTSGTVIFALSNTVTQVGAKPGNVGTNNDLGFDFSSNNNALQVNEYGRIPGSGAGYCGFTHGGSDVYPYETSTGLVCTPGDPRIPYGQVQPLRPESDLYYRVPRWGDWSPGETTPEVIANEAVAFFISAQNGTTITGGTSTSVDRTIVGGAVIKAS